MLPTPECVSLRNQHTRQCARPCRYYPPCRAGCVEGGSEQSLPPPRSPCGTGGRARGEKRSLAPCPCERSPVPPHPLTRETWLILPVVIRLSQRLSHACLSISIIQRNCEWLIISVIVYLIVPTTWITVVILELIHAPTPDCSRGKDVFIRYNQPFGFLVNHNN